MKTKDSKEEILDFIDRRFPEESGTWTNQNCYWFAKILEDAFGCEIYYMPIQGHFIAKDPKYDWYYDQTGLVIPNEPIINFNKLKADDIIWYTRLVRDCIM